MSRLKSKKLIQQIYLDSCVLIAYFSTNKSELDKKKIVKECFEAIQTLEGVELVTSYWALSEMVNVLISRHKMKTPQVSKIEQEFSNTERLGMLKVRLIDISPLKDYSVKEFLYKVRAVILRHHPGVGDSMHSVIMKNNTISTILTFDMKSDFKSIPGLTVINPIQFLEGFKK